MPATAPVLGELKVARQSANPANPLVAGLYASFVGRIQPQEWTAVQATFVSTRGRVDDPFAAIRPEIAETAPRLRLTEGDSKSLPLRSVESSGERYRGRHGRLVVLKRK